MDYLESVVPDTYFSNDELFVDYLLDLEYLSPYNDYGITFVKEASAVKESSFTKANIIKIDDRIYEAAASREANYDLIRERLMEFRAKIISTANPATRALVKARMKKLLDCLLN